MGFEWDSQKNESNVARHGIDFEDVRQVFDGVYLERVDDRFDYGEQRTVAYGLMERQVIAVVYTWRGERRRIIKATRLETKVYWEVIHGDKPAKRRHSSGEGQTPD